MQHGAFKKIIIIYSFLNRFFIVLRLRNSSYIPKNTKRCLRCLFKFMFKNFSADQTGRPRLNRLKLPYSDCYTPGRTCQSSALEVYFYSPTAIARCTGQLTGHLSPSRPPVSFQLENLNRPSAIPKMAFLSYRWTLSGVLPSLSHALSLSPSL